MLDSSEQQSEQQKHWSDGWSASLLFTDSIRQVFSWGGPVWWQHTKLNVHVTECMNMTTLQETWINEDRECRPVWSVFTVRMEKRWVLGTKRRLIRLGGCPAWSVSSHFVVLQLKLTWLFYRGTPRRKLSLSNLDTPDPVHPPSVERSTSSDSGLYLRTLKHILWVFGYHFLYFSRKTYIWVLERIISPRWFK